jgi:hypothetical protein
MWGDRTWGESAYAEPQDNTIAPFQDRRVFAEISFIVEGAGAALQPGVGAMEFGFDAGAVGAFSRQKVRVIQTAPRSGRSRTGLHNESV